MKTIQIAKTKPYKVHALVREKGDAKSIRGTVLITGTANPCELTEAQALNLIDSLEKAVAKLRKS